MNSMTVRMWVKMSSFTSLLNAIIVVFIKFQSSNVSHLYFCSKSQAINIIYKFLKESSYFPHKCNLYNYINLENTVHTYFEFFLEN